jgi:sphingomyelin phosphodiesterase 2
VRGGVEKGRFVIGVTCLFSSPLTALQAGDLNSYSNSIVHDIVTQHGFVVDAWEAVHPEAPIDPACLSDQAQIDILGVTCDSRLNSFCPDNLEKETDDPNAKRIDYIFTSETQIEEVKVAATEKIPGHNISYSDHFGVSATIILPSQDELRHFSKLGYLSQDTFRKIREVTTSYIIREQKYAFIRIGHFYLGICVVFSMWICIWFVESKAAIFVMLWMASVFAWCGFLDGCIGFIWGRWEQRTLREFAGEIELARKVYAEQEEALRIAGPV